MSRTVVVTGAAGFIGSHLARALSSRDDRVIGVDNFDPFYGRAIKEANVRGLDPSRFRLVEDDVCDADAMATLFERERPEGIVHLAALAGVRPSVLDPARFARVNVDGLVSVLEAARRGGARWFVFASSSSVYGNARVVPFSESDPAVEPISPYAATKRAGELICHAHAHLHGLPVIALRFFTVYGPAQRPDLAISVFLRRIAAGEEITMYGDGSSSRDYTYVGDAVAGVVAACDLLRSSSGPSFRILNLGGADPVTLADLIDAVAGVVGREPRVRLMPMQPGDVARTCADLTLSREVLGYEPRTQLAEGLRRQWGWMREQRD